MRNNPKARFESEQLHEAAQDGDIQRVISLLGNNYPVNKFDSLGKTPLHYAVAAGRLDVVDALLCAGANVNARDERVNGNTPLADSSDSCSFEMAERLVGAGADPTIRGWMSLNAIDRARRCQKDERVVRLLEAAANPDM